MSTIPTIPIIYSKPIHYNQTMELYWRTPSSDGGSNIIGYVIENLNNPNHNFFLSSEIRNFKIFNLINDENYSFGIKAYNENGNSNIAIFDSAIPGSTPVIPTNIDFSVNANANASFSWVNGIGGYRPTDIEGLALWLDLADTNTTTVSGNTLIGITDKSPYQNQITVNSTRPTYNPTLLNGRPGITFNGNSWLRGQFFSNIKPTLGDRYLIAGSSFNGTGGNTIVYSNDNGTTWTPSPNCNNIFNNSCNSIAYNGRRWVAGGQGLNTLAYSDDGINWLPSNNGNNLFMFVNTVVWGNGMWIAGGYGVTKVAYSYDGLEWISSTSGNNLFFGGCSKITFGNSMFVAAATIGFYNLSTILGYSRDGINWTQATPSSMTDIYDIGYSKSLNQWMITGEFVSTGNSNENDLTLVNTVDPNVQYYKVSFPNPSPGTGNGLLTVGYNPSTQNVVSVSLKNMYYPDNNFIPTQLNGYGLSNEIELQNGSGYRIVFYLYSGPFVPSDAIGTTRSFNIKWWYPGNASVFEPPARNYTRINLTSNAGAANYSYDGITWTTSNVSSIFNNKAYDIFYASGLWVASGLGSNTSKIAYSTDGINFSEATSASGLTQATGGITFNGTNWYAVGSNSNYMIRSTDAITWTTVTSINNYVNSALRCITSKNVLPYDIKYVEENNTVFYSDNQFTVFAVASMNSSTNTYGRLVSFNDSRTATNDTQTPKAIPILRYGGNNSLSSYKDGADRAAVGITVGANTIITSVYNGTTFNIYTNGTGSSGNYANKIGINNFGIGHQGWFNTGAGVDFWNGNFYECLVYFGALNSLQRLYIEGYLAWKWGLQSSLINTHLYRLNNPSLLNNIFTPNIVPNCQLWLDASNQNNFTLSNGNVSVWLDRSTNANHFNGNGQRLLNFDLSKRMVNFPTGNIGFMNSIGNYNYTQGSTQLLIVAQGNSGTIFSTQFKVLAFGNGVLTGSPGNSGNEAEYSGNGVSTNTHRYNVTSNTYTSMYLLNAGAGTNWGGTPTNTTAYIGYKGGYNESSPFTGNIFEIIAYSSLNTENLTLLQGYLSWKWGLNNVIPASHAYTSFNPNNYEGYEIIPKIRNMVTLIPYDNTGNVINQANLKIYGTTYTNVTNRSLFINNTNYSYRGVIQSISNVGYSTPVYTEKFHPNVVTNGLSLWLDPFDVSTFTTSNSLVTRWEDKSRNKSNATATLLNTRSLVPTDISGLRLWIDAQDSSNITLSANSNIVASITDKSPNRYIFSGASGFTYNETKFNTSYPSFYNSNISSANNLGANTTITLTQPLTVFYVGRFNTAFTAGYLHDGTTSTNRIAFHQDTGEFFAGNSVFGSAGTLVQNFIVSGYFNSTNTMGYINGAVTPYASGNGGTDNGTSLLLGNRYSLNYAWGGHICEILMYNGVLSLRNRRRIEGYLAQKWGLTSSLPNYHPFKSIIPLHPEPIAPSYDSANGYITFNGSEYLTLPNSTIPSVNSDYTMFLYLNTKASTETQWALFSGQQTANLALGSFLNTSNVVHSWWNNNLTGNLLLSNNVGYLTSYTYSSNVRSMYINGSLVGMDNVSVRNSNIANNIIGNNNSFDIGLLGKIGDIVVYNRLLPIHERRAVENYILSRRLFSILSVSNIQLWLDASDPNNNNTLPSNGSTVTIWYDKSGNQNNGIQYLTNGIPTYNSTSNSISFNNQMYVLTNPITQIGTIFIVGKKFTSNGNTLSGRASNGYSPYYIAIKSDVSLTVSKTDNSLVNYQALPSNFNQTTLFTGIITSSSVSAILNGGTNTVSQNYTGTLKIATETYLGASWYDNIVSLPTSSEINEIIIFNRALSIDERYKVEGYLAWKWSITNNLPSDHPYKNSVPTN
jgi:hypothetical protein